LHRGNQIKEKQKKQGGNELVKDIFNDLLANSSTGTGFVRTKIGKEDGNFLLNKRWELLPPLFVYLTNPAQVLVCGARSVMPSGGDDGTGQGPKIAHAHKDEELAKGARHTERGNLTAGKPAAQYIFA
jgi:hypothetical protein